ncbi:MULTISPECIES: sigma-54-dependent transcriptional regulator [Eikenella]|uniref:Response regulator n=1 Tax=Eikenella exigua TaxID=2528037 RepID=A0AAX1F861_9NEIS|nr:MULTISPECIES: sigma-54 dependent transcriptional regulator [Eikenella]OAM28510.1 transcriptional regulator [Eikenella sp. NML01-A-086]OAM41362.1 transcriptional regulator [Eikenella sp. NML97-A-109]QED92262.1 response regulator [Eikenella exigua]
MSKQSLQKPVLVVDDEQDIRDLMEMTLMKMGLSVETAEGVNAAKKWLDSKKFSLVLTDMRMPDGSGLEVVEYINEKELDVPVAVITAFGNADQAVQAIKTGAFDYLQKPITLAQLRTLVKSAIKIHEEDSHPAPAPAKKDNSAKAESADEGLPESEDSEFHPEQKPPVAESQDSKAASRKLQPTADKQPAANPEDIPRLIGRSPQIEEARQMIRKLARTTVPVYIAGESGSGKEQAARSIHELSERHSRPFVAVNCGAIPENLMESEFFGYKKGSFTGADQDRLGFFQHAHGGTLFLDEVADLPLHMQVKLLRAIQEKAVRRIGDAQEVKVNVRIISATHKDLAGLVTKGAFRQDLFYRLNVVSLTMPPLREMREDLPQLITQLLRKHRQGSYYTLTQPAKQALLQYSYPGNFRELENILERAVALAADNTIDAADLQLSSSPLLEEDDNWGSAIDAVGQNSSSAETAAPESSGQLDNLPGFVLGRTQVQDYLDDVERLIIEQALQKTRYNRTQAAKLLGISFRSMRYRMERLEIE